MYTHRVEELVLSYHDVVMYDPGTVRRLSSMPVSSQQQYLGLTFTGIIQFSEGFVNRNHYRRLGLFPSLNYTPRATSRRLAESYPETYGRRTRSLRV